jgi:uncharacterized protein (DUF2141 family)
LKKDYDLLIYIIFLYIFSACANRVTPTGGDKDIKPPVLLNARPAEKSTNFHADEIVLTFDEYVQLKDLNQQLIVSPLMDPPPSVTVKKKSVMIDVPDTLKEHTTYTINFGTSITDIHEGNIIPYQYVFSTGDYIDSMKISGTATDALSGKGEKGIKVMLYNDDDDSLPFKNKPDYFAPTDSNGTFTIQNIGPGSYNIVALNDKNSNYKVDSQQEEALSVKFKVAVNTDMLPLKLVYFTEPAQGLYIKNVLNTGAGKWSIVLNRSADSAIIKPLTPVHYITEWSPAHDSLFLWTRDSSVKDTISFIIASGIYADTTVIKMKATTGKSAAATGRGGGKSLFLESENVTGGLSPLYNPLLIFAAPITSLDNKKIILTEDSINVNFRISYADSVHRLMEIIYPFKEDKHYALDILPSALVDYTGKTNDSIALKFVVKSERELGDLKINIPALSNSNWLLQLTDDASKIKYSQPVNSAGKYEFSKIEPGTYRLRLINDENNNGRWDTGNYFQHIQPETVLYYAGNVTARANWEVEIEWKTDK